SVHEPDRGVLHERTSLELVAGDEDVGTVRQRYRLGAEIDEADERVAARERDHVLACGYPLERARPPGRLPAQPKPGAVEREHRGHVVRFRLDRERRPVVRLVEPRTRGAVLAEAVRRTVARPRDRDAAAVATGIDPARA